MRAQGPTRATGDVPDKGLVALGNGLQLDQVSTGTGLHEPVDSLRAGPEQVPQFGAHLITA